MTNLTFLKTTNKTLEILFKSIFRYFTSWVLILHSIYYLGIDNFQYSLLFLTLIVSISGFIITYIHPKNIIVPYFNINIDGYKLKFFDLVCHQLPLIILYFKYNKAIKNDNLIFGISIMILYLCFNNPIKVYNI